LGDITQHLFNGSGQVLSPWFVPWTEDEIDKYLYKQLEDSESSYNYNYYNNVSNPQLPSGGKKKKIVKKY
jgi:hypothetical protein